MFDIVIIGAGGHAKMIIDIINADKTFNIVGIVDVKSREVEDYILVGSRAWEVEFSKDENMKYCQFSKMKPA